MNIEQLIKAELNNFMSDYAQEYYITGKLSTTEDLLKQFRTRIDKLIERNR
nr:MAG TPA: YppF-like protein [Caudoviricetes sp.]